MHSTWREQRNAMDEVGPDGFPYDALYDEDSLQLAMNVIAFVLGNYSLGMALYEEGFIAGALRNFGLNNVRVINEREFGTNWGLYFEGKTGTYIIEFCDGIVLIVEDRHEDQLMKNMSVIFCSQGFYPHNGTEITGSYQDLIVSDMFEFTMS